MVQRDQWVPALEVSWCHRMFVLGSGPSLRTSLVALGWNVPLVSPPLLHPAPFSLPASTQKAYGSLLFSVNFHCVYRFETWVFKILLFWVNIRLLKKNCKKKERKKEFPCAHHPVSLNVNILPNMQWSSPGNPRWSCTISLNSWPYAHFTSLAPNVLCLFSNPFCILSLCLLRLLQCQVLSLSFSVMTLTLWHVLVSRLECPSKRLVWGRSFGAGTSPEMTLCPPRCILSRRSWCWCVLFLVRLALGP